MTGVTYSQVSGPDPNQDVTHLPPLPPLLPLIPATPSLGCLRLTGAAEATISSHKAGVLTSWPAAATHNRPIW